jgi:hypothetical protein
VCTVVLARPPDSCYIGNIYGAGVDNSGSVARFVLVDPNGKLGTVSVPVGGDVPEVPQGAQLQGPEEAMLNRKVKELQKQVEILTAQLKEQAAQIQKVSAQVEMSKPAAKVVNNN